MLLQLFDGRLVETVGIPADADGGGRLTVCVSSQVNFFVGQQDAAPRLLFGIAGPSVLSCHGQSPAVSEHANAVTTGEPSYQQARAAQLSLAKLRAQVGCPMRCSFCATGAGGFARGLSPAEIVDQVLTVQEAFGQRVSNVGALRPLRRPPAACVT